MYFETFGFSSLGVLGVLALTKCAGPRFKKNGVLVVGISISDFCKSEGREEFALILCPSMSVLPPLPK